MRQIKARSAGRMELLAWLNAVLETDYARIEELADGAAFLQLFDCVFPATVCVCAPLAELRLHAFTGATREIPVSATPGALLTDRSEGEARQPGAVGLDPLPAQDYQGAGGGQDRGWALPGVISVLPGWWGCLISILGRRVLHILAGTRRRPGDVRAPAVVP